MLPAELLRRTRPTSSPSTCRRAAAPAFGARLVLAATLSPSYGIYSGLRAAARTCPSRHGSEEYLDSEKYEVKRARARRPAAPAGRRLNGIRRANRSLPALDNVTFLETAQRPAARLREAGRPGDTVIVVREPRSARATPKGSLTSTGELGLPDAFVVQDLLTERLRLADRRQLRAAPARRRPRAGGPMTATS